ncbi:MAG: response regulator [FCB group bacterium]|jgi:CheY-like chemotaxis protein
MTETKGTILWIDDEIELLRPHIILIEQRGYKVEKATNAEDALELLREHHFGLIFLDESMVGMSGLDALPLLKEIDPYTPIVMVTKNEAESVMDEAIGKKIDDYLTKPVNPTQIIAAIKKYLESRKIKSDKLSQDYLQGFHEISRRIRDSLNWDEWLEIYLKLVSWSMELDTNPELGFEQTLRDQWRECNGEFSKFIEDNYIGWLQKNKEEDAPMLSPEIVDNYLIPLLANGKPTFFFVIDCLRLDQWLVMEEMLQPYYNFQRNYYCSILPTATPYARNAIFAGLFPIDIQKYYPKWWVGETNNEEHKANAYEKELLEEHLKRKKISLSKPVNYVKIHDTEFGKRIEGNMLSYVENQLNAIVINSVDMIAHSRSDYAILKEIAPDEPAYRSLTRSWFQHSSFFSMLKILSDQDVNIIVTTDHGSIRCMRGVKVIGDKETSTCLRYKFGKNVKAEQRHAMQISNPNEFRLPNTGVTINNIIAKEDYYFVYPTDFHHYLQKYRDSFQHGGISLEEMIIPVITLKSK